MSQLSDFTQLLQNQQISKQAPPIGFQQSLYNVAIYYSRRCHVKYPNPHGTTTADVHGLNTAQFFGGSNSVLGMTSLSQRPPDQSVEMHLIRVSTRLVR